MLLHVRSFMTIYSAECSEKLVIDTDGGADDAAAILLAISAWEKNDSDFEVVAITCVNGNTVIKNVEKNVLKTITIGNATQVNNFTFFVTFSTIVFFNRFPSMQEEQKSP